ncbi:hypothetical protein ACHAWU_010183 [Discostella pseudostelligera]|uniref:Uncharacterized protein n=1 Tax=Discostella pseudostelligera TaxID=259834 RepID=A0ABD3MAY8_9STRA
MPISEQAQRAWKAGTAVITSFTAFYGLFYFDYGPGEHCFTDIQSWYRKKVDGLLGINLEAARSSSSSRQLQQQQQQISEEESKQQPREDSS